MTIGIPIEIDKRSVITTVFDATETYNPKIKSIFAKEKKLQAGDDIYINTGSIINPRQFNNSDIANYSNGDYVFGDPNNYGFNGLYKYIITDGESPKNPQDYTTGYDNTSFAYNQWTKRYVKLADSFVNGTITQSVNNVTWILKELDNGYIETTIKYNGGLEYRADDVLARTMALSDSIDDPAELIAPTDANTYMFWIPRSIIINPSGVFMRTHLTDASVAPEFVTVNGIFVYMRSISLIDEFVYLEKNNKMKPFDGKNYSVAKSSGAMNYSLKGLSDFNSITLSRVLADSVTINVKNSSGSIIQTFQKEIDGRCDRDGILPSYYTTEIFYAINTDTPMYSKDYTVEINLLGENIELGHIKLTKAVDAGFSNLAISHTIKDFSTLENDVFGNDDYVERVRVIKHSGTVDIKIDDYDMINRFFLSIGKKVIVFDAADNLDHTKKTMFQASQMVCRAISISQSTVVKNNDIDKISKYNITIEEIV